MAEDISFEQKIQSGLDLPDEKKIYFNGLTVSISIPDVVIVLQQNDKPVALLNASHSTAKTMVALLQGVLESFERNSEHPILMFGEYQERLNANLQEDKDGES